MFLICYWWLVCIFCSDWSVLPVCRNTDIVSVSSISFSFSSSFSLSAVPLIGKVIIEPCRYVINSNFYHLQVSGLVKKSGLTQIIVANCRFDSSPWGRCCYCTHQFHCSQGVYEWPKNFLQEGVVTKALLRWKVFIGNLHFCCHTRIFLQDH